MPDDPLGVLAPVDFVIIEFPAGQRNLTGEAAEELLALVEAGSIRVIDMIILVKNDDPASMSWNSPTSKTSGRSRRCRPNSRSSSPKTTSSTSQPRWTPAASLASSSTRTSGPHRSRQRSAAQAAN